MDTKPKDYTYTGYNKNHQKLAEKLRDALTPQERHLWYGFLSNYPVKIYRQRSIDRFVVDFYCSAAHLAIELDGSQHYTEAGLKYDAERTTILEHYGISVLRFSNLDVDKNFKGVCETIHNAIQSRIGR